jgi:hypothetical protein
MQLQEQLESIFVHTIVQAEREVAQIPAVDLNQLTPLRCSQFC